MIAVVIFLIATAIQEWPIMANEAIENECPESTPTGDTVVLKIDRAFWISNKRNLKKVVIELDGIYQRPNMSQVNGYSKSTLVRENTAEMDAMRRRIFGNKYIGNSGATSTKPEPAKSQTPEQSKLKTELSQRLNQEKKADLPPHDAFNFSGDVEIVTINGVTTVRAANGENPHQDNLEAERLQRLSNKTRRKNEDLLAPKTETETQAPNLNEDQIRREKMKKSWEDREKILQATKTTKPTELPKKQNQDELKKIKDAKLRDDKEKIAAVPKTKSSASSHQTPAPVVDGLADAIKEARAKRNGIFGGNTELEKSEQLISKGNKDSDVIRNLVEAAQKFKQLREDLKTLPNGHEKTDFRKNEVSPALALLAVANDAAEAAAANDAAAAAALAAQQDAEMKESEDEEIQTRKKESEDEELQRAIQMSLEDTEPTKKTVSVNCYSDECFSDEEMQGVIDSTPETDVLPSTQNTERPEEVTELVGPSETPMQDTSADINNANHEVSPPGVRIWKPIWTVVVMVFSAVLGFLHLNRG